MEARWNATVLLKRLSLSAVEETTVILDVRVTGPAPSVLLLETRSNHITVQDARRRVQFHQRQPILRLDSISHPFRPSSRQFSSVPHSTAPHLGREQSTATGAAASINHKCGWRILASRKHFLHFLAWALRALKMNQSNTAARLKIVKDLGACDSDSVV